MSNRYHMSSAYSRFFFFFLNISVMKIYHFRGYYLYTRLFKLFTSRFLVGKCLIHLRSESPRCAFGPYPDFYFFHFSFTDLQLIENRTGLYFKAHANNTCSKEIIRGGGFRIILSDDTQNTRRGHARTSI